MDNIERKRLGLPYRYDDPALLGDQHVHQDKMVEYNATLPTQAQRRHRCGSVKIDIWDCGESHGFDSDRGSNR